MTNEFEYDPFNFAIISSGEDEVYRTIERTRLSQITGRITRKEVLISPTSIKLIPVNIIE